jgi:hypothetical protein
MICWICAKRGTEGAVAAQEEAGTEKVRAKYKSHDVDSIFETPLFRVPSKIDRIFHDSGTCSDG